KFNLGYLHIMDGLAFGFHEKGEPMALAEFKPVYRGIIIGNCGYTKETAEERIAEGNADLIGFGRPFITNPDLPERFANNWSLNPAEDMSLWYTPGPEGYTDYSDFTEPSSQ
ncbi:MAG: alkene reductase, partial [Desulfobulbaceae bacterium]|nr:alkene reductase [Desulfobulbaceae bacterium]